MIVNTCHRISHLDLPGNIWLQPPQSGGRLDVRPVRVHRGALGESIRLLGLYGSSCVSLTVPTHRGWVLSKPTKQTQATTGKIQEIKTHVQTSKLICIFFEILSMLFMYKKTLKKAFLIFQLQFDVF